MHRLWLFLFLIGTGSTLFAQQDIAVGTWRTHNSYNRLIGVTSSNDLIYAAGSSALFSYNLSSGELNSITSISGLSDADITAIGYNAETDQLIVTYQNGNIDIIKDNRVTNLTDLLMASFSTSKKVNHIYSYNEYSYLSADFGVMILNMATLQVKDTYFELGSNGEVLKINSSIIKGDSLYLGTADGVIRGNLNDNLKDFNLWLRYDTSDGIPQSDAKVVLATTSGILATIDNQGIYEKTGSVWEKRNTLENEAILSGSQDANQSIITTETGVYIYETGSTNQIINELIIAPKATAVQSGALIVADGLNGLVLPGSNINIYPNGPFENYIVNLFSYLDKVIAMPQAYDNSYQPLRSNNGFSIFSNGEWENFSSGNYPHTTLIPEFLDITDAMYSYASQKLFLSSFGYGILAIDGETNTVYNESNSSLININPPEPNTYVTALDANSSGLSSINFSAGQALNFYNINEGLWEATAVPFPGSNATQLLSFNNNSFWMRTPQALGGGIIVFDQAGQDTLYLNNYLPSNGVNDMALDLEGKMWVATDRGIVYFYNAENILDQNQIEPVEPIYDGNILFRNEKITALAIDGGNRIWMGTSSGLWLFGDDGQDLVEYFQASDSPLPSDNILKIAINHDSGEVFIATDKGLVSYRGTSTMAGKQDPVKIFPNPVLSSEHDLVTIEGVPTNADLWITDASGRLVYRTRANGNTAIWSGISSNLKLSSGVYFVFIATEDGSEKQIGKIALVN